MKVGTLKRNWYLCSRTGTLDQTTYPAKDNQGFFMEIQTFLLESDIYYQAVAYSPEDIEAALQENQE